MIKIELTFTSIAEATAFLAGREGNAAVATASTAGQSVSTASSTKPGASAGKAEKPGKDTKPEKTAEEKKPEPAGVDYETEVKPLILKLAALPEEHGGGSPGAKKVFKSFDAAKGSDVPAEKHADLKAALEAAITSAEAAVEAADLG